MSAENNNLISILKKNPLVSLSVLGVIIGVIVFIVMRRSEEAFSTSSDKIVENFPQSVPMNVMYSDASGNLGTTIDLGLQNLTVNGDSLVTGNSITGNATVKGDSVVTGDATVTGNSAVTGNLAVTGNMTTKGDSVVTGNSTVKGDSNLNGNVLSRDLFGGGSQLKTDTIAAGTAYGGRLHILGDNVYVMAKNGVRIATDPNSKNPWGDSNGNLTVDGAATVGGALSAGSVNTRSVNIYNYGDVKTKMLELTTRVANLEALFNRVANLESNTIKVNDRIRINGDQGMLGACGWSPCGGMQAAVWTGDPGRAGMSIGRG
jgi:hypothetical protein